MELTQEQVQARLRVFFWVKHDPEIDLPISPLEVLESLIKNTSEKELLESEYKMEIIAEQIKYLANSKSYLKLLTKDPLYDYQSTYGLTPSGEMTAIGPLARNILVFLKEKEKTGFRSKRFSVRRIAISIGGGLKLIKQHLQDLVTAGYVQDLGQSWGRETYRLSDKGRDYLGDNTVQAGSKAYRLIKGVLATIVLGLIVAIVYDFLIKAIFM